MHSRFITMSILLFFLSLWAFSVSAMQQAGKVISVSGTLVAVSAQGEQRKLTRRSHFFEGDVLKTGDGSRAQIRFLDGAIMALRAGTEFRVDQFSYQNKEDGDDKSIGTLIKGGMRTITGVIGKADPKSYQMNTPVATIGVRGTIYEAVIADGLSVAAWQGAITVTNDAGSMELGRGADFNFAQIASQVATPKGLLKPPAVMQQPEGGADGVAPPPPQEEGDAPAPEPKSQEQPQEQPQDGSVEPAPDDQPPPPPVVDPATGEPVAPESGEDAMLPPLEGEQPLVGGVEPVPASAPMDSTQDPALAPSTGAVIMDPTVDPMVTDPMVMDANYDPAFDPAFDPALDPALSGETTFAGAGLIYDPALKPPLNPALNPTITTTDTVSVALTDLRLAGISFLPNGGTAVFTGVGAPHALGGPSTIGYIDGSPVITTSYLYPDDPNFLNAPILEVVKGQPSGIFNKSSFLQIGWGKWNSVKVETDPNDPSVGWVYNQPAYWITFDPRKGDLSGLTGGVYSKTGSVEFRALGSGSAGGITEANVSVFSMNVNFATATISSGVMDFNNGDAWHLQFSGVLRGPIAELTVDQGSSTVNASNAVRGDIGGGFTGANAEGFAGDFDVEQMSNPNVHAEGVFHVIRP